MVRRSTSFMVFLVLTGLMSKVTGTQVFKCTINGTVSYQSVSCPSGPSGKRPTIDQLNAAEKLKRERQASESPAKAPAPSGQQMPYTSPVGSPPNAAPAAVPGRSFNCDGRTRCSQMTSCEEAKYFLANCPGVKMDGSRGGSGPGNGIPCERESNLCYTPR
ncbi:calcium-binding protein [uncultured Sphaerotilus sp.]|uniref:calcium-binding protein n=1 Tax=uncultured Sphaerotilus sp. TaxID=474984 RepID=UPI0030CA37C4